MALQVWLPLNGDLHNQGISSVTVSNSGATVSNNGKIGKCYSFANSNYLSLNTIPYSKLTNCSVCFWICLDAGDESWLPCTGQTTSYYFLATQNNTGAFYHQNVGSNTKTIYRDGVVGTTPLPAGSWHHYCITGLDLSGWSMFLINLYGSTGAGWNFTGRMNDFRIYDHCLSPKEVKEISKGLVLHYKLDGGSLKGSENLVNGLNGGGQCTISGNTVSVSGNNSDTYFYIKTTQALTSGKTYKISCTGSFADGKYYYFPIGGQSNTGPGQLVVKNGYCSMVFVANNAIANGGTTIILDDTTRSPGAGTIGNIMLEEIIGASDSSGYGRNGEFINQNFLSESSNSARYNSAIDFGSDNSTYHPNCGAIRTPFTWNGCEACTISFWINPIGCHSLFCFSNTSGAGGYTSNYLQHFDSYVFLGYQSGRNVLLQPTLNSWHHYTIVYDSTSLKLYVDGALNKTNTFSSSVTMDNISYLFVNHCCAGGVDRKSATKMSDFRIYSTALSADDIKELYDTSAIIYNDGTIAAREFSEEGTSEDITKTGIVKVGNLVELADNTLVLSDGSLWVRLLHHNNPSSYMFTSSNCWHKTDDANLYSVLDLLRSTAWANSDGEYEFLFCEKLTSSSTEQQFRWKQTSNPALSSTLSGYQLISGSPGRTIGIMNKGFAAAMHNGNSFWCECGAYSGYNGGIAGASGAVTTGYFDLYVRMFGPTIKGADANLCQFYENAIVAKEIIEI